MKKNKIAIIGYGIVGKGMHKIFPDAITYDITDFSSKEEQETAQHIINQTCGLAIICVPTPPKGMQEQRVDEFESEFRPVDLKAVYDVVNWLKIDNTLIKSAIPPGTLDKIDNINNGNFCVSPEYLGESKYYTPYDSLDPKDARQHPFMVIGGSSEACDSILAFFTQALGPTKFYYKCTAVEAELIKYMENTWGAMKVTFMNEWFEICKVYKASFYSVREGWALDPRVEKNHSMVFENDRGFAGKCYPKDLLGIIAASEKKGYNPKLLKEVWNTNKRMRKL